MPLRMRFTNRDAERVTAFYILSRGKKCGEYANIEFRPAVALVVVRSFFIRNEIFVRRPSGNVRIRFFRSIGPVNIRS